MNDGFSEGYVLGRDSSTSTNGNTSGMNGDWSSWIIIFLIFAIFGWGGNGTGFGGRENGGGGAVMTGYATQADLQRGFDTNSIINKLDNIGNGICDSTYALNTSLLNGFAGVQNQLCQCCNGINSNITTSGYETRSAITDLGYNLQNCCCQTQRAIDGVNYNLATNSCAITTAIANSSRDIIDSQRAGTDAILGYLTNEKISSLQTELALAQGQLSQANQTNNIVNALRPTPVPAYPVFAPSMSFAQPAGVSFGVANTTGCGCNNL